MTVEELLDVAEKRIGRSDNVDLWRPSDARVNAEELLSAVLGKEVTSDDLDDEVPYSLERKFWKMVKRRVDGEPVALIVGFTEFRNLRLIVRKGSFIPRNSSELLAEKAIARLKRRPDPIGVDVATGTGPVALAMANEVKKAKIYGADIWAPAVKLAQENAKSLKLRNVEFVKSDMLKDLPPAIRGKVDVFTIHPPYVARSVVKSLPKEIKDFEPKVSLTDNSHDGLGLPRLLVEQAPGWLRKGGWVMIEVSPDLSRAVRSILIKGGFKDVKSERDSLGATRVISGRI